MKIELLKHAITRNLVLTGLGALLLAGGSLWLMRRAMATRYGTALEIHAIAHQWWWEFDYPSGVRTADELRIPEGQSVRLDLTSADVLHSFWLPSMKRGVDVIPGRDTTLILGSRSRGTLYGSCDAGCGCNTVCMRFRVLVSKDSEFTQWIEKQHRVPLKVPHRSAPACALNPKVDRGRSPVAGRRLQKILAQ
jgi:cytochrome c oxidase subunit 2